MEMMHQAFPCQKSAARLRGGRPARRRCQAGGGPAREGEPGRGQGRAQSPGPPAVASGRAGYLLDERAASALGVPGSDTTDP